MYTGLFPIRGLASSFYQLAMVFFHIPVLVVLPSPFDLMFGLVRRVRMDILELKQSPQIMTKKRVVKVLPAKLVKLTNSLIRHLRNEVTSTMDGGARDFSGMKPCSNNTSSREVACCAVGD